MKCDRVGHLSVSEGIEGARRSWGGGETRAAREDNWPKVAGDDEKKERAK